MNQNQYANLVRQARSLFAQRMHSDARTACEHLLRFNRKSPEALMLLAEMDWEEMNRANAIKRLERYLRLYPKDGKARIMLGDWLRNQGQPKKAAVHLEKLLRNSPGNPFALAALARCYMVAGDNDRALRLLQPHIGKSGEHSMVARVYAALQSNLKNYDEAIAAASRHVVRDDINPTIRTEMCFVLGQSLEKIGEYEKAFKAYELANAINPPAYDPSESREQVTRLIDTFTRSTLDRLPRATSDSSSAVFVISRPRSGSTMVERIIAAHPEAHAAGELTLVSTIAHSLQLSIGSTLEFPEVVQDLDESDLNRISEDYLSQTMALSPAAKRITNKYLSNWTLLGLIELMLPQARVIDLRRNTIDNCLACFGADLGSRHPYSYDLRHIGLAHRDYERMMQHWKDVLSISILTVNYEDIIADQEGWTRRIIDFCGLPWDEACLHFHQAGEKSQRATAPTLSYNQVRQPLYKSSVGRAERFAAYLGPLKEGLEEGLRYWAEHRPTADSASALT